MDKEKRVLSNLTERLDEIIHKLKDINKESTWMECMLSKDKCKSFTSMKNVLESLVEKTTDDKNHDDDISLFFSKGKKDIRKQPQFQNLITSEEYLEETKKLMKSNSKRDHLQKYLLTFRELLGDIIFSVCQINNYQLKLPSGILVKDLIKLKKQYISIWESLTSSSNECNSNIRQKEEKEQCYNECSTELQIKIGELHRLLQCCLKEMSKVKLEIEHYFKSNIIEMQFLESDEQIISNKPMDLSEQLTWTKFRSPPNTDVIQFAHEGSITSSVSDRDSQLQNEPSELQASNLQANTTRGDKLDSNTENVKNTAKVNRLFIQKETNTTENKIWNDIKNGELFLGTPPEREIYNPPPSVLLTMNLKESSCKDTHSNEYLYPPMVEEWKDWYNSTNTNNAKNVFNESFICPPDFLLFDPNMIRPTQIQPPPKIYSLDSVNEIFSNKHNSYINDETSTSEKENIDFEEEQNYQEETEESIELTSTWNSSVDLFRDEDTTRCERKSDNLQQKLSTLFNMLNTDQTNNCEDLFPIIPGKITNNVLSYQKQWATKKLGSNDSKETFAINKNSIYDYTDSENKINIPDEKKVCQQNTRPEKSDLTQYNGNTADKEYPVKLASTYESEVLYDKKSVIELFKTTEINYVSNSGSNQETSRFCLWPVQADYIHVTKDKRNNSCQSSSSDTIPLTKSFEKSFFSLHLNKGYEQNRLYDGDLIVLENPNEEYSSCSLLNKPHAFLDINEKEVNGSKNQTILAKYNEFSKAKNFQVLCCSKADIVKKKNNTDAQKTVTVQYADCRNPFLAQNDAFNRNNFDFLKINGYDDNHNWNSFISIFTSKVGPSARINHHRMFRKIIGTEPLTDPNLFNKVHTLTSNGGPFRLFDLNGYPLTDSSGKVLTDPYGKNVVTLDSTGFPKDDLTVFDAAGNSPKDVNFDPTQKPKTNTIIIKLTDNFKRPLHLFDKYGRPLTDSCGRLLVNIHGRPLLRFDNFGRPNTDYRGGPLYTDNGYKWSYKTGESFSKERLSSETVTARKLTNEFGNEMEDFYEPIDLSHKYNDLDKTELRSGVTNEFQRDTCILTNTTSDIWAKVENVLQHLPKRKPLEPKKSHTSVIVNNVTIPKSPFEKDLLKSIIYHNKFLEQDDQNNSMNLLNTTNNTKLYEIQGLQNKFITSNKPVTEGHMSNNIRKEIYKDNIIDDKKYYSCNNLLLKDLWTNSQINKVQPGYLLPPDIFKPKTDSFRNPILSAEDLLSKNGLFTISTDKQIMNNKRTLSYFSFKNHDYLNNLCNKIITSQINYEKKAQPSINSATVNKNWTTTSVTGITSSVESKYTSDSTTNMESPVKLRDLYRKISEPLRKPKTNSGATNCKECKKLDSLLKTNESGPNKVKVPDLYLKNKGTYNDDPIKNKEKVKCQNNKKCQKKTFRSISEEAALSIKVKEEKDKHYGIKCAERINKKSSDREFESHLDKNTKKEHCNSHQGKNHLKAIQHNKIDKDSPFRYLSETQIEFNKEIENKVEVKYIRGKDCDVDSSMSSQKDITNKQQKCFYSTGHGCDNLPVGENIYHKEVKNQNYIQKCLLKACEPKQDLVHSKKVPEQKNSNLGKKDLSTLKKPVLINKECNLVSFLGSPVKYVLNKLDSKRETKQHNFSKSNTFPKSINRNLSQGNTTKCNYATIPQYTSKHANETKIKSGVCNEEYTQSKKEIVLSNEKRHDKVENKTCFTQSSDLLALQKRSAENLGKNKLLTMSFSGTETDSQHLKDPASTHTECLCGDKTICMSYSGDENDVENTNCEKLSKDLSLQKNENSMGCSAASYMAKKRQQENNRLHCTRKQEPGKLKHKVEQYSFKTSTTRKKRATPSQNETTKQSNGRLHKSTLASSKNKSKDVEGFFTKFSSKRNHKVKQSK